jgi:hypothetical protein
MAGFETAVKGKWSPGGGGADRSIIGQVLAGARP